MGNIYLYLFIFNIIIISLLFWVVSFLNFLTIRNKNYYLSNTIYECGFKSVTNINLSIKIGSIIAVIFLIMYEIEFILLIPIFFNTNFLSNVSLLNLIFFFIFLVLTFYLDIYLNAIKWIY